MLHNPAIEPKASEPVSARRFLMLVLVLGLVIVGLLVLIGCLSQKTRSVPVSGTGTVRVPTTGYMPAPAGIEVDRRYSFAGEPVAHEPLLVLTNIGYVVGYSETRRNPMWGCYRLHRTDTFHAPPRPKSFRPDLRTKCRVTSGDYTASGYDRGHLGAPNYAMGLCYGAAAQEETFLMSNIAPQKPRMNQDVFENLERTEIRVYAQRYGQIWVTSGTIFGTDTRRLKSGVEVPDACFHVIARQDRGGTPKLLSLIIPQSVTGTEGLDTFLVSVDDIESKTGLDLFAELDVHLQQSIEAEKSSTMW